MTSFRLELRRSGVGTFGTRFPEIRFYCGESNVPLERSGTSFALPLEFATFRPLEDTSSIPFSPHFIIATPSLLFGNTVFGMPSTLFLSDDGCASACNSTQVPCGALKMECVSGCGLGKLSSITSGFHHFTIFAQNLRWLVSRVA